MQHLLCRAAGDADAVRDDLTRYVAEHRGRSDGVLVVDETGFRKKGTKSVGVGRPSRGAAGRIENCQGGVFLGYVTEHGRALLDRALHLPKDGAADAERRQEAGVPQDTTFATKLVLARRMIERAVAAGVPARWVTADAVDGSDDAFRKAVEDRRRGYVVGVRTDHALCIGWQQRRVKALLAEIPAPSGRRRSCGDGAKGPRLYDGACGPVNCPEPERSARWRLIRRRTTEPTDAAYFVGGGPPATTRRELVQSAGRRGAIEECFEIAPGVCGLDAYEVRSGIGWHRHVTLRRFALGVLTVIRARAAKAARQKKGRRR